MNNNIMMSVHTKVSSFLIILIMSCYISLIPSTIYANTFPPNTPYKVCFTPDNDCTSIIVTEINQAKKSIYLQAYSFTSAPIAKAITNAKNRGINVEVILDKSQVRNNKYSSAKYLMNQKVPVWIDYHPAIAHNKVIIIDNNTVITGSFNFTKAAQEKNAENVLIISDDNLAKLYRDNFIRRQSESFKAH